MKRSALRPDSGPLLFSMFLDAISLNTRDSSKIELAKQHFKKRARVIRRFQETIDRHLTYVKAETLRKLEKYLIRKAGSQEKNLSTNSRFPNWSLVTGHLSLAVNAGVAADLIFDLEQFADGLLFALRNESADALQTAGQELFEEIGRDDPWQTPAREALQFLEQRQNLLRDVPNEIFTKIEQTIEDGINAGDSIREMSKRITAAFDEISQSRATTIASTETGAAYGFARNEAMKKAGVEFKSWLTSHLPNVRPAHALAELQNQHVPADEPFDVGGEKLMYPGDPAGSPENVINCHCVALVVA